MCQRKSIHVWCVCSCVYVHLTSLSLFSYLLAFLPWLFLLSFFRSDWDLSRESCFILCSIWYLLNVAWSRGKIHVNAGTPAWYLPEPYQVQKIQERVYSFRITGSVLICNFSVVKIGEILFQKVIEATYYLYYYYCYLLFCNFYLTHLFDIMII